MESETAWALVVEHQDIAWRVIRGMLRRGRKVTYSATWEAGDLYEYVIEGMYRAALHHDEDDIQRNLLAVAAKRGAAEGIRDLERLDGRTRSGKRHALVTYMAWQTGADFPYEDPDFAHIENVEYMRRVLPDYPLSLALYLGETLVYSAALVGFNKRRGWRWRKEAIEATEMEW